MFESESSPSSNSVSASASECECLRCLQVQQQLTKSHGRVPPPVAVESSGSDITDSVPSSPLSVVDSLTLLRAQTDIRRHCPRRETQSTSNNSSWSASASVTSPLTSDWSVSDSQQSPESHQPQCQVSQVARRLLQDATNFDRQLQQMTLNLSEMKLTIQDLISNTSTRSVVDSTSPHNEQSAHGCPFTPSLQSSFLSLPSTLEKYWNTDETSDADNTMLTDTDTDGDNTTTLYMAQSTILYTDSASNTAQHLDDTPLSACDMSCIPHSSCASHSHNKTQLLQQSGVSGQVQEWLSVAHKQMDHLALKLQLICHQQTTQGEMCKERRSRGTQTSLGQGQVRAMVSHFETLALFKQATNKPTKQH